MRRRSSSALRGPAAVVVAGRQGGPPGPRGDASRRAARVAAHQRRRSGEVVAFLEVGDQTRAGRLPAEQLAGDLRRGGAVEPPEAAEPADVLPGLLGGDGYRGNAEMRGEDPGDLADRHALVANRVQRRPGGGGLQREAEQARGVVAVDRWPAVGAVADVSRGALLA